MSDIVDRLRVDGASKIEWEAAAEILALRRTIDSMHNKSIDEAVDRAWLKSVEIISPTERDRALELIDAIAECIVARQGLPNRDRAKAVLDEIEAQGWRLLPPKEEP